MNNKVQAMGHLAWEVVHPYGTPTLCPTSGSLKPVLPIPILQPIQKSHQSLAVAKLAKEHPTSLKAN